jgi:hypothetical protein
MMGEKYACRGIDFARLLSNHCKLRLFKDLAFRLLFARW